MTRPAPSSEARPRLTSPESTGGSNPRRREICLPWPLLKPLGVRQPLPVNFHSPTILKHLLKCQWLFLRDVLPPWKIPAALPPLVRHFSVSALKARPLLYP